MESATDSITFWGFNPATNTFSLEKSWLHWKVGRVDIDDEKKIKFDTDKKRWNCITARILKLEYSKHQFTMEIA